MSSYMRAHNNNSKIVTLAFKPNNYSTMEQGINGMKKIRVSMAKFTNNGDMPLIVVDFHALIWFTSFLCLAPLSAVSPIKKNP